MIIKGFGKQISVDDNNKGLTFLMDELCETPTESWAITEYAAMNEVDVETAKETLNQMTADQMKLFYKKAMIWTIQDCEEVSGTNLEEYKNAIHNIN